MLKVNFRWCALRSRESYVVMHRISTTVKWNACQTDLNTDFAAFLGVRSLVRKKIWKHSAERLVDLVAC